MLRLDIHLSRCRSPVVVPSESCRKGGNMRVLISVLIMLVFSGCTDSPPAIHDWKISGARTVRYLLTDADKTVLLILDPTQCFTCSGVMAEWLTGKRCGRIGLQLVLNLQLLEERNGLFD